MIRPFKVAIVGAGPAGFYTASRILSRIPKGTPQGDVTEVHIYDRLWTPHGLIRYGVAPDHPEVKNCTHKFDETAIDSRFRFFGNVSLSSTAPYQPYVASVPLESLFLHYTHLVLSHGASTPTPMSKLSHSRSALSLVHWYTGHPSLPPPPSLSSTSHLTLIGHGNVSLDIARILLSPVSDLSKYDIPEHVLAALAASKVKHVSIVSRRGPAEVAFTAKELREMMSIPDTSLIPLDPSLLDPENLPKLTRQQSRLLDLLRKGSKASHGTTSKTWSLEFFRSPIATPSLNEITFALNELDEQRRARPTGESEQRKTDLVVTSIGYRSDPLMGTDGDDWLDPVLGRIRNVKGRVHTAQDSLVKNVYTSGWASNGAKGVLGTTMYDAYDVADLILSDHIATSESGSGTIEPVAASTLVPMNPSPSPGIPSPIQQSNLSQRIFDYSDWKRIDAEETRRGEARGKERERMGWNEVVKFI